jgi:hypothetical protein
MGFFYLYYAIGLPTFFSIVIALYLLFTGTRIRIRIVCLLLLTPDTVARA